MQSRDVSATDMRPSSQRRSLIVRPVFASSVWPPPLPLIDGFSLGHGRRPDDNECGSWRLATAIQHNSTCNRRRPELASRREQVDMPFDPGTRLGPYEILELAGAGGMGEVYRARDTRLRRTVAIKVASSRMSEDPHLRARFQHEARAIAALNHPHICAIPRCCDRSRRPRRNRDGVSRG